MYHCLYYMSLLIFLTTQITIYTMEYNHDIQKKGKGISTRHIAPAQSQSEMQASMTIQLQGYKKYIVPLEFLKTSSIIKEMLHNNRTNETIVLNVPFEQLSIWFTWYIISTSKPTYESYALIKSLGAQQRRLLYETAQNFKIETLSEWINYTNLKESKEKGRISNYISENTKWLLDHSYQPPTGFFPIFVQENPQLNL